MLQGGVLDLPLAMAIGVLATVPEQESLLKVGFEPHPLVLPGVTHPTPSTTIQPQENDQTLAPWGRFLD